MLMTICSVLSEHVIAFSSAIVDPFRCMYEHVRAAGHTAAPSKTLRASNQVG